MPVYPFLLSLLCRPELNDSAFLARAQRFNVNLSAVILLVLFFLYRRHFPDYYCLLLVGLTAFAVFIYHAAIAQAELLYYLLSLGSFLAFWKMLRAPALQVALYSGALAGVTYLTKASNLPALGLFSAAFVAGILHRYQTRKTSASELARRSALFLLTLATFLAVVFPYIQTSKRIFGHYFYNVNSTFYLWCDSWPQAKSLTGAHGDRLGWPTLPADQIPSASKYWQEHSLAQIPGRLSRGGLKLTSHNIRIEGYYKYLVLLAASAAVLAWKRRVQLRTIVRASFSLGFFLGSFFVAYFLLYAWYVPISSDSRFLLALFLPFVFTASKFFIGFGQGETIRFGGKKFAALFALSFALLLFGAIDFAYVGIELLLAP